MEYPLFSQSNTPLTIHPASLALAPDPQYSVMVQATIPQRPEHNPPPMIRREPLTDQVRDKLMETSHLQLLLFIRHNRLHENEHSKPIEGLIILILELCDNKDRSTWCLQHFIRFFRGSLHAVQFKLVLVLHVDFLGAGAVDLICVSKSGV